MLVSLQATCRMVSHVIPTCNNVVVQCVWYGCHGMLPCEWFVTVRTWWTLSWLLLVVITCVLCWSMKGHDISAADEGHTQPALQARAHVREAFAVCYQCLWQKHSFCTSPRPAVPQQKLQSSPWCGALKVNIPMRIIFRRSVFVHRHRYSSPWFCRTLARSRLAPSRAVQPSDAPPMRIHSNEGPLWEMLKHIQWTDTLTTPALTTVHNNV